MRICLVSQEYPPETARGGIGSQTWAKAHTLAAAGHEVHVLSSSAGSEPELRTEQRDGVTVHRMTPPGVEWPVYGQATFWLGYSWAVLRHLSALMAAHRFDVVDFAEYGGEGFAYQLDRTPWNWAPVVVQLHGPLAMFAHRIGWPEVDSDLYRVGTAMEDLSIKRADALMACSANIADFTAGFHGVLREGIDVVHCGVDVGMFSPPEANGRSSRPPMILFTGNLAANKGARTVFEAALRLREEHPDLKLVMLGRGDDDLAREFERRAAEAGAGDDFEVGAFVSDRSRLPDFYREATAFCSPAQHEVGVANVYIEAMACGCPVVACDTGGAPEAIVHGETGYLVPFGDVDATTGALDRMVRDTQLRGRLGEAARARAVDVFAMDRYIARVMSTYERAIETARSQRDLLVEA